MPYFIYDRHLDLVEAATCEGCGLQFEIGELAPVPCVDSDLRWCEECRKQCPDCPHILGVHSRYKTLECDGNGEPGDCHCTRHIEVPARLTVKAAAIPGGVWMSGRFKVRLRKEGRQ